MPETTVTCPHCGDVTQQDMLLDEFTCGKCDKPFSPRRDAALEAMMRETRELGLYD